MSRLKLMTIIGTRPEIIRLSACIKAFDRYFDHILVHTGQNWTRTLNEIFFDEMDIRRPDCNLSCAGETLGDTMGNIIAASYRVLQQEMPDALLVLGDTNSALSVIPAKRLKIPIFHMEAGNRCFDLNVPEEINRRIVDHVSDINLAYTEHARRYLLAEGIQKEHIFVTGSPMTEVLRDYAEKIDASGILGKLGLSQGAYLVVSAHREENIDRESTFMTLMRAINAAACAYQIPVIFSVHPRSMKQITRLGFEFDPLVRCLEPFGFLDYCKLQKNAFCVLSDSGTLSEESAILGFAAVLLRTSTERPEALDKGSVVIAGTGDKDILQAVELAAAMRSGGEPAAPVPDYADVNVSAKVVRIIQSYTKIIDQNVWKKGAAYDAGINQQGGN
ncbi:MAG TPA: UDP-N-acetylglucosamine 2-epimerase (non-hydrolyzing) [Anaerovoracaceae bacterium]|nr:UDP-N-acetylglucosamine 2-epimerase (non-hydrolyzing) [Anaerovoracaceae bacterium]